MSKLDDGAAIAAARFGPVAPTAPADLDPTRPIDRGRLAAIARHGDPGRRDAAAELLRRHRAAERAAAAATVETDTTTEPAVRKAPDMGQGGTGAMPTAGGLDLGRALAAERYGTPAA